MSKKVGKFEIGLDLINEHPEVVAAVFKNGVIPLRAECLIWKGAIEYVAICDQFEETEEGALPAAYDIGAEQDGEGNITVSFTKAG